MLRTFQMPHRSYKISQQTAYNMDLILSLKLVGDDALRSGIEIEFHSLGAVYAG